MASKKKKNFDESDLQVKEVPQYSPLDLQFNGTTEAEYQEPVVPVAPVDPLEREYPGLHQDIPKILKAILRELVIARCEK